MQTVETDLNRRLRALRVTSALAAIPDVLLSRNKRRQCQTMKVSLGTVHALPADVRKALVTSSKALAAWNDIKPLARNEWICWIISVKNSETSEGPCAKSVFRAYRRECAGRVAG